VILENIVECTINPHCTSGGVIGYSARHSASKGFVHFVDSACGIDGFAPIGISLLDQVAITIVEELQMVVKNKLRFISRVLVETLFIFEV
jgi:hypothetical protein